MTAEPGLRERKKEQTRRLLAETARRLFLERGFDAVTVAEVAREADVSQATVFNYFPTKEDLVFAGMEAFEEELLDAIRERPAGEPISAAFSRFVLRPRGLLSSPNPDAIERLTSITRLIETSPSLRAHEHQILHRYTESLARLIAEETGAPADDVEPRVVANALMGIHRALLGYVRRRVLAGDDSKRIARDFRAQGKRAFARLDGGLREYGA